MATFKITSDDSVLLSTFAGVAFHEDTPSADTLIVDPEAYLISTGTAGRGASLAATGAWKVTVNGQIVGGLYGLVLDGAGGSSSISIGADGSIGGSTSAIRLTGTGTTKIDNKGTIIGTSGTAIEGTIGNDTVTNSGWIFGEIDLADGTNSFTNKKGTVDFGYAGGSGIDKVTNSGIIGGNVELGDGANTFSNAKASSIYGEVKGGTGTDTATNAGSISGKVDFGNGVNKLTNSAGAEVTGGYKGGADADTITNSGSLLFSVKLGDGTNSLNNAKTGVSSYVEGGSGKDTVINSGQITSDVVLFGGENTLTNSGTILGRYFGGAQADTVTNTGTLGDVDLANGSNRLTNSGVLGSILGGADSDVITNSGSITGSIDLGAGDDTFTNSAGTQSFVSLDLGDGQDTYNGGTGLDFINDSNGGDKISLGGGDDWYFAALAPGVDGLDTIDGGTGRDYYDAGGATHSVFINLDSVAHDLSPIAPGDGQVAGNTATGDDIGTDTIKGFEDAQGGSATDVLYGNSAANYLGGNGSTDYLFGFGGNDILDGGSGSDVLVGGGGRDELFGGTGIDYFLFTALSDSGKTAATRDTILDFEDGIDIISLALIDANTANGSATNDSFSYVNGDSSTLPAAKFTGVAGQLRSYWSADGVIFEGDVNGDKKADFSFLVSDRDHSIVFTSADFQL